MLLIHPIKVPDFCLVEGFAHYLQVDLHGLLKAPIHISKEKNSLVFYPINEDVIPIIERKTLETVNTMILLEHQQLKEEIRKTQEMIEWAFRRAYRNRGDDIMEKADILDDIATILGEFLAIETEDRQYDWCPYCDEKSLYDRGDRIICAGCDHDDIQKCPKCDQYTVKPGEICDDCFTLSGSP